MPSNTLPRPAACLAALLVAAPLAACSGSSGPTVAVQATETACEVADTSLAAGSTTFSVHNNGSKVTEVYVYAPKGTTFSKVVGEAEDIGPGTTRSLDVDLSKGSYEVACKPGQKGDGIRTRITVTG